MFRDPQTAFNDAISSGMLSLNRGDANFAGLYMYMYSKGVVDYFKHIHTRDYIAVKLVDNNSN